MLFSIPNLCAEGFSCETLVSTAKGFVPIEQLHLNDQVICYDLNHSYVEQTIIAIKKNLISSYSPIKVGNMGEFLEGTELGKQVKKRN